MFLYIDELFLFVHFKKGYYLWPNYQTTMAQNFLQDSKRVTHVGKERQTDGHTLS